MNKPTTAGHAPVNGLKMYYEIHGTGTMPLVLVHGGGSTIESSFSELLPLLAANHKVIAVELQAHGRTSDRNAPESFTQDADDVAALLKYLKVEKADLLGFSNGGSTVLQVAIRHPQLVHKVIAISAAYQREGFLSGLFENLQKATINDMPAPLKADFLKVTPSEQGLQNMFEKDRERMLTFKDWPDTELASIKAPVLFIASQHDAVTVEHTVKMSRLVINSQLMILPGMHGQCIGEVTTAKKGSKMPQLTAGLIGEFLQE